MKDLQPGLPFPNWVLVDQDGQKVTVSQLKGNWVVLFNTSNRDTACAESITRIGTNLKGREVIFAGHGPKLPGATNVVSLVAFPQDLWPLDHDSGISFLIIDHQGNFRRALPHAPVETSYDQIVGEISALQSKWLSAW